MPSPLKMLPLPQTPSKAKRVTTISPSSAKKKKADCKSYVFELELPESTDDNYPEFSWAELVKEADAKEAAEKLSKGPTTLDPYASDDEEQLKALAARFETKYGNSKPTGSKKKFRTRASDYIDLGAGYDEEDSFIDNSDAYDEVVPQEIQTQHGGFYINHGKLDYKEMELSDSDSAEEEVKKRTKTDSKQKKNTPSKLTKAGEPAVKLKPKKIKHKIPAGSSSSKSNNATPEIKPDAMDHSRIVPEAKTPPTTSANRIMDGNQSKTVSISSTSFSSSSSSNKTIASSDSDNLSSSDEDTNEKKTEEIKKSSFSKTASFPETPKSSVNKNSTPSKSSETKKFLIPSKPSVTRKILMPSKPTTVTKKINPTPSKSSSTVQSQEATTSKLNSQMSAVKPIARKPQNSIKKPKLILPKKVISKMLVSTSARELNADNSSSEDMMEEVTPEELAKIRAKNKSAPPKKKTISQGINTSLDVSQSTEAKIQHKAKTVLKRQSEEFSSPIKISPSCVRIEKLQTNFCTPNLLSPTIVTISNQPSSSIRTQDKP